MPPDELQPTFAALISALAPLRLAYLHLTEPRVSGQLASRKDDAPGLPESLDWAADLWRAAGTALVLAGGYMPASAAKRVEEGKTTGQEVLVAFGRFFISNVRRVLLRGARADAVWKPDLVERARNGIPFAPYDRPTFYTPGATGYTDYPTAAAGPKAAL